MAAGGMVLPPLIVISFCRTSSILLWIFSFHFSFLHFVLHTPDRTLIPAPRIYKMRRALRKRPVQTHLCTAMVWESHCMTLKTEYPDSRFRSEDPLSVSYLPKTFRFSGCAAFVLPYSGDKPCRNIDRTSWTAPGRSVSILHLYNRIKTVNIDTVRTLWTQTFRAQLLPENWNVSFLWICV